jgi:protein phosphatase
MQEPTHPSSFQHERGPFDIIGDIHGCYNELRDLLQTLGWTTDEQTQETTLKAAIGDIPHSAVHTLHSLRKLVFLGDLVDRGPGVVEVLRLVIAMVGAGRAICLLGNHDDKLLRKLMGRNVRVAHGLAETLDQLEREPSEFVDRVRDFLAGLLTYHVLDEGRLVVAHAGIKENLIGLWNDRARSFTLYGDTTGESDEFGLPVRLDWAANYHGEALVVYGHTPVPEPRWMNNTVNIDTGCIFGGKLTALRYPEREIVSIPARRVYYERAGGIR